MQTFSLQMLQLPDLYSCTVKKTIVFTETRRGSCIILGARCGLFFHAKNKLHKHKNKKQSRLRSRTWTLLQRMDFTVSSRVVLTIQSGVIAFSACSKTSKSLSETVWENGSLRTPELCKLLVSLFSGSSTKYS